MEFSKFLLQSCMTNPCFHGNSKVNSDKIKIIIFYTTSKEPWIQERLNELNSRQKKPSICEQRTMVSASIAGSWHLVQIGVHREKAHIEREKEQEESSRSQIRGQAGEMKQNLKEPQTQNKLLYLTILPSLLKGKGKLSFTPHQKKKKVALEKSGKISERTIFNHGSSHVYTKLWFKNI